MEHADENGSLVSYQTPPREYWLCDTPWRHAVADPPLLFPRPTPAPTNLDHQRLYKLAREAGCIGADRAATLVLKKEGQ